MTIKPSNEEGLIICLSGPSGVGKGTVIRKMLETRSDMRLSISMTSRSPRYNEQDGIHYHFTDRANFEELIRQSKILEYDEYMDNYYGTPEAPIRELVAQGISMLLDLTVVGALAVKRKFPQALTVFLMPPSQAALKKRLSSRGTESGEIIERRLAVAASEISQAVEFDYVIINDDLESTVAKFSSICTAEQSRTERMGEAIARLQKEFCQYS
ncbi:MAG TPA: guanylate kinase [Bacillota bacterium]|nr:guanylate kinase [Bacillota bacterium]